MKLKFLSQFVLALATLGAAGGAFAQYVWLDEHGVKQFSDIAPPANVPESRILKQPHRAGEMPAAAPADSAAANSPSDDAKAPPTTAEQNAAYNKRKQEQADKAKKADDDAKRQAAKADACARATSYLNTLKSGVRVTTTDTSGERSYMPDDVRATEEAQAQSQVDANCR